MSTLSSKLTFIADQLFIVMDEAHPSDHSICQLSADWPYHFVHIVDGFFEDNAVDTVAIIVRVFYFLLLLSCLTHKHISIMMMIIIIIIINFAASARTIL